MYDVVQTDDLAQDMYDVELENEDAMEGQGSSDTASALRDDADVVFEKHSGDQEIPLFSPFRLYTLYLVCRLES